MISMEKRKKYGIEEVRPMEIEARSFNIIREELNQRKVQLPKEAAPIIMRCIHTSADFSYVTDLYFGNDPISAANRALMNKESIITDTQMAMAGINKKKLATFGGKIHCFMSDDSVAKEANLRGITRAVVSMERAAKLGGHPIIAIGNAPTALIHLCEMIEAGEISPSLVIGAPVGFVNVIPAKRMLTDLDIPQITVQGNKGGSNIAACICNALMYQTTVTKPE